MDFAKVFISSISNPLTEDLRAERETARAAVESHAFLRAWAFEVEPASTKDLSESYLGQVDVCDLFILIVGGEATNPVMEECLRARNGNKPILVFAKCVPQRTASAVALLEMAGKKYATFSTLDELERVVRDGIGQALVEGLRAFADSLSGLPTHEWREMVRQKAVVHIRPTVPEEYDAEFQIEREERDILFVRNLPSERIIEIPVHRIEELLPAMTNKRPVLRLDGRIQWVTIDSSWRFFEETPVSEYGCDKVSSFKDPRVDEIEKLVTERGIKLGWMSEGAIPHRLKPNHEIYYDTDGRYFRVQIAPVTRS